MLARRRHLARNTLLVGASFGLPAAAGLVRNMVIARQFGIGANLDAYYAAFKLPELLFTVVAGGALATAFIPVLAGFLAEEDLEGAWRLASAITNLVHEALSLGLATGCPSHSRLRDGDSSLRPDPLPPSNQFCARISLWYTNPESRCRPEPCPGQNGG